MRKRNDRGAKHPCAWRRATLAAMVAAWVGPAAGQISVACPPATYVQWSSPTSSTGAASLPAHDTTFRVSGSLAYFVQGKKLLAFRNVADAGGAAGTKAWEWCKDAGCASSTTLLNFPSPVPLSDGSEALFVGADDGFLYKIGALDGQTDGAVDTRRMVDGFPVCGTAPGDALYATPAVVLYNYASSVPGSRGAQFRAAVNDDVVIVFTANGCGDTTHNRIIAYSASNLAVKWTFNADGALKVDRGTEGCTIDYDNMRLFCGADLAADATAQNSLFALDVITGQLLWAANAGAILNRPMLNYQTNRLYVANKAGSLMAYNPAGNGAGLGQPLWPVPLAVASTGTVISRPPAVEQRAGTWQNKILALDSGGTLHAIQDNGSNGAVLWDLNPESGVQFRSLPVVLPGGTVSHAFLGRDDGTLQMIELGATGATPRGAIIIEQNAPGADVYDPSIDYEGGSPRMVVAGGTTLKRLQIPLCLTAPF